MTKSYTSLKNPGLLWGILVAAYAVLAFPFIGLDAKWLWGIPPVTWLIGGGGLLTVPLCVALIPAIRSWEND